MVFVVAGRIGEARHVQPMAAPLFSIPRRCQQPVNHFPESIRRLIRHEITNFPLRWRQPMQIISDAPQKRMFFSLRRWLYALFFQLLQHKRINGRLHPTGIFHCRHDSFLHRLKRPKLPFIVRKCRSVFPRPGARKCRPRARLLVHTRPRRPHLHPFANLGDLVILQLSHRRHLQRAFIAQCHQHQTLFRRLHVNQRSARAAREKRLPGRHVKP